jgi:hypothetical protein
LNAKAGNYSYLWGPVENQAEKPVENQRESKAEKPVESPAEKPD